MSMLSTTTVLLACLGALLTGTVYGFPFGAPNFACRSMRPNHPSVSQPAETLPVNIAFFPERALPGDVIDVHVWVKDPWDRFQGMLVTARSVLALDTPESGFISTNDTHFKLLNCTGSSGKTNNGLTHRDRLSTDRASFKWRVPGDASLGSTYLLRFTIVLDTYIYWVGMNTTFTVGRPSAQPEVTRPTPALSRFPGQGSASRMTSPVTGSGSKIDTTHAPNQQPVGLLPEGTSHTGQSPLNGQQTGSSQENGQQSGSPQISGGQSTAVPRINGQAEPATTIGPATEATTSSTGQSNPRNADPTQPIVDSRQSGKAPGVTPGTAGIRLPPRGQRPPQSSPPGLRSTGIPASGRSPQGTPARGRAGLVSSAVEVARPVELPKNPVRGRAGLNSSTVGVATPAPERNQVAGVTDTPVQRTNTLPEARKRQGRVLGSAGGSGTAHSASGMASGSSGAMAAWLAGWFGR